MILGTGATGTVGAELINLLSARGENVRAFVGYAKRKTPLSGVEFFEDDFTNPESFLDALEGGDRLFLLIPSSAEVEGQQKTFVDAAKQRNVRHIIVRNWVRTSGRRLIRSPQADDIGSGGHYTANDAL